MVVHANSTAGEGHAHESLTAVLLDGAKRGGAPCWTFVPDTPGAPTRDVSFGELIEWGLCVAGVLGDEGVKPGDRVAVVASPSPEWMAAFVGVVLAGAVAVPLNHGSTARELSSTFATVEPTAVLVDDGTDPAVRGALNTRDSAPRVVPLVGADSRSVPSLVPSELYVPNPSDPAVILSTSGTTGRPKGVVRTHGQYAVFLDFWSRAAFFPDDRVLNFLPLYHQGGLVLSFLSAFTAGVPSFHLEKYSTSAFWSAIRRFSLTWTMLMQPVPRYLLDEPPSPSDTDHTLRWVLATAAPDDWLAIQDRFGIAFHSSYGSTETTVVRLTGTRVDGPTSRARVKGPRGGGLCGRAIEGWADVRITSEQGGTARPDELGAIEVRGVPVVEEYFADPAATSAAFTDDGWFTTGDIGYVTDDGDLYIVDRAVNRIRRSGENIAPREIEELLEEHPAIAHAAVVPVADVLRGEEIRACIVLEPGARLVAEDVFRYCREHLARFKVPRYVDFRDDLPRTPTLKVRKDALVAEPNSTWVDRLQDLPDVQPGVRDG